jgi:fructose-bisphosphate aldolase class II
MSKVNLLLEMELGVTGGEEDGVDNSDVDSSKLYTQPEEVYEVYKALKAVPNGKFTVAAAFGNVHGVYAPGNVELTPVILHNTQKYISEKEPDVGDKPVSFVFHGGSGSSREDIRYAIEAGTIKMNIDTDTQWSFWDGIRAYEAKNRDYLQAQIGNPEGETKPNKKYYDPRMSLRSGEESMAKRLGGTCAERPPSPLSHLSPCPPAPPRLLTSPSAGLGSRVACCPPQRPWRTSTASTSFKHRRSSGSNACTRADRGWWRERLLPHPTWVPPRV